MLEDHFPSDRDALPGAFLVILVLQHGLFRARMTMIDNAYHDNDDMDDMDDMDDTDDTDDTADTDDTDDTDNSDDTDNKCEVNDSEDKGKERDKGIVSLMAGSTTNKPEISTLGYSEDT